MKHILITGGGGFIGFHLARYLSNKGYDVDIADNFSRGVQDSELDDLSRKENVNVIHVDLLKDPLQEKLGGHYRYIFHLAAIIGVAHVLHQPFEVLRKNVEMIIKLLDFAKNQQSLERFLFASSSEIYAGTLAYYDLPIPTPEDTPITLTPPESPRTSYMLSKIYGEAMCHQSGIPFSIFRPHNVYGPRMGLSHVIPELLKKAHDAPENGAIDVYSPDHTRTFCYIGDAVEFLCRIAESPECINQTLNLGSQKPEITIRELASLIVRITGKGLKIHELPATTGSPRRRAPDMKKTKQLTGYESIVNLEDGVCQTYQWYRDNIFNEKEVSAK